MKVKKNYKNFILNSYKIIVFKRDHKVRPAFIGYNFYKLNYKGR